jgi:hypothetical protein
VKKAAFKGITIIFTILFAFSFIIIPADGALTWSIDKVVSDNSVREGCSLVLDSAGNPWISYNVEEGLKVLHFTGAKWETETVDDTGDAISAIAINNDGEPVIVYVDSINFIIECAERVDSKWPPWPSACSRSTHRVTMPRAPVPCYIYCSKGSRFTAVSRTDGAR